jgi:YVTN family beta-propeller protein
MSQDGRWLFVANRGSGSISVFDTIRREPISEMSLGGRLADVAITSDGRFLLAVDEAAGELIGVRLQGHHLELAWRVPVPATPVSVRVASDGKHCTVASLWSRQLAILDLTFLPDKPQVERTVDLSFAPRAQVPIPAGNRMVVADSFNGRLAVVDIGAGKVERVQTLPSHNIRGLCLDHHGRLLVAHQILHPFAQTTRDDIHWGNLLGNHLRVLPLASVLQTGGNPLRDNDLVLLGDVGHGTGDPAGIAVAPNGMVAIALAGVGEVALGKEPDWNWRYVSVGRGPTAVTFSPDGQRAFVVNTFSDSVSVVDAKAGTVVKETGLGPSRVPSAVERGEELFHDARLAQEGWFSCQSCHTDGHSNGLLADTLGDGTYGTPKRIPSLLGVADTRPYAWNGSIPDLESQVRKSIETTLRGSPLSSNQVDDLTAYLRSLPPAPPRQRLLGQIEAEVVERGQKVFADHSCDRCHTPPRYTAAHSYDVGLADEAGWRLFNPPSLRGVSQGGPFFHDGRATSLSEIFTRHHHQIKHELTPADLRALLAFLATL